MILNSEYRVQWHFSKPDPQKIGPPWISVNFLSPSWAILCKKKSHKTGHPSKTAICFGPIPDRFWEVSLYLYPYKVNINLLCLFVLTHLILMYRFLYLDKVNTNLLYRCVLTHLVCIYCFRHQQRTWSIWRTLSDRCISVSLQGGLGFLVLLTYVGCRFLVTDKGYVWYQIEQRSILGHSNNYLFQSIQMAIIFMIILQLNMTKLKQSIYVQRYAYYRASDDKILTNLCFITISRFEYLLLQ
jgi:hypothetical protein